MHKPPYYLLGLLALLPAGCNRQDTEALTRIGKKVQARAEVVTGDMKINAASSWQAVGDYGIDGRVAARLRWDRELAGAAIQVVHVSDGVELRGTVHDYEQHRRAVMIAETTTGVEGVKDSLTEEQR
jgi:osmotically-inducible protein OsmY